MVSVMQRIFKRNHRVSGHLHAILVVIIVGGLLTGAGAVTTQKPTTHKRSTHMTKSTTHARHVSAHYSLTTNTTDLTLAPLQLWWINCMNDGGDQASVKLATDAELECCGGVLGCDCVKRGCNETTHKTDANCLLPALAKCLGKCDQVANHSVAFCQALPTRSFVARNPWIWLVFAGVLVALLVLVVICLMCCKKFGASSGSGRKHSTRSMRTNSRRSRRSLKAKSRQSRASRCSKRTKRSKRVSTKRKRAPGTRASGTRTSGTRVSGTRVSGTRAPGTRVLHRSATAKISTTHVLGIHPPAFSSKQLKRSTMPNTSFLQKACE